MAINTDRRNYRLMCVKAVRNRYTKTADHHAIRSKVQRTESDSFSFFVLRGASLITVEFLIAQYIDRRFRMTACAPFSPFIVETFR